MPQDDLMMAQILSQVPENLISKETARAEFSFIDNTSHEAQLVKKEIEEQMSTMIDLDRVGGNE